MGIEDKISGRLKQAAGDLLGHDGLKRQGRQEERKADAEGELKEAEARLRAEEQRAEAEKDDAERRAAAAARKEFEKAERRIAAERENVDAARAQAEAKREEKRDLELRTDPVELAESSTKDELYEEAARLGVEGRSEMTKDELAAEITARK